MELLVILMTIVIKLVAYVNYINNLLEALRHLLLVFKHRKANDRDSQHFAFHTILQYV